MGWAALVRHAKTVPALLLASALILTGVLGPFRPGAPGGAGHGRVAAIPPPLVPTLRQLAVPTGLRVGAAVDVNALTDPGYASALGAEYDMVTPENAMKWGTTEPRPGRFDFTGADGLVRFAGSHGMVVRGHNLVWFEQNPPWLERAATGPGAAGRMRTALERHVTTLVSHFRGRAAQWDVVNEAVGDDGTLRPDLWLQSMGPAYIADAFEAAHTADPGATLFYNDYGIEQPGPKADAVYALLGSLRARGVPVGGVGFELHVTGPAAFDAAALRRQMARFAGLGLEVAVTEMDVRMRPPFSAARLGLQAADYAGALRACQEQPACHTFVTWGFTDGDSWVPGTFPGFGAALPFDKRLRPKPAAYALQAALSSAPPAS